MLFDFISNALLITVLVSVILAGLRRSTGQKLRTHLISNRILTYIAIVVLLVGELAMDRLTVFARASRYFANDRQTTECPLGDLSKDGVPEEGGKKPSQVASESQN